MADTWGSLSWSVGNFGAQNDSTVDVTGASLSLSQGTSIAEGTVDFGWGRDAWDTLSWGVNYQNAFGDVTGNSISSNLASVTTEANANITPTAAALTAALGEESAFTDVEFTLSSFSLTANLNNVDADPDANATGQAMSMATGSVVVEDDINIGWGRNDGWNTFAWGIGGTLLASGQQATATLDSVTTQANADVDVTGELLTATQGNEDTEISFEITLTGQSLTSNLGNVDPGPDAVITGQEATMAQGDTIAYNLEGWGRYFYGEYVWGATGIWANPELTGIGLSANLGTLSITADANLTLTGIEMTAAEGNLDADPDANVIGQEATMALNSVTTTADSNLDLTGFALSANLGTAVLDANSLIDLTGFGLTASLNSVQEVNADAFVIPTGIGMTASEGSIFALIWNEVQTDSSTTWTEIDTAA
ncbi:MAG: hypothetical protein VW915_02130 [Gammaproteobacteria bacterium]